ncbi:MAG: hypothetical protein D6681_16920 [Calditrichaeota bacterium]|nr:MAG: hypothetical protein D6681_16920 [Calditrichota bacterium]
MMKPSLFVRRSAKASGIWLLTGLLLFGTLSCGGSRRTPVPQRDPRKASYFYYEATRDIEQGLFVSALAKLDSAILYKPGVASYYQVRGWLLEQLGQPDSAIAAYQTCLRYRSNYPKVLVRLGELYMSKGIYDQAAFYLRKGVQAYPDSARIYLLLGQAYIKQGKFRLALDYLRDYRKIRPSPETEFWKWLGMAYVQAERYPEAVEALEQYVAETPDDPEVLKTLALAEFTLKRYDQAISYLNRAGQLLPNDGEVYLYRARYFRIMNKPDVAVEQLKLGLLRDSTNVDILFELGVVEYEHGNYPQSEGYFRRVIELAPQYWKAYRYLGFLAERAGDLEQAESYYRQYLEHTFQSDPEVERRLQAIQSGHHKD